MIRKIKSKLKAKIKRVKNQEQSKESEEMNQRKQQEKTSRKRIRRSKPSKIIDADVSNIINGNAKGKKEVKKCYESKGN